MKRKCQVHHTSLIDCFTFKEVNGLVSLGIFYGVCAISNWLAPAVLTLTGGLKNN